MASFPIAWTSEKQRTQYDSLNHLSRSLEGDLSSKGLSRQRGEPVAQEGRDSGKRFSESGLKVMSILLQGIPRKGGLGRVKEGVCEHPWRC